MTTHDSTSWNVHRETLCEHAHEVDGVHYIGGRGVRLAQLLERTYVEEAHQLGNDLAECLAKLPPALAQQTLDGMKGALGQAAGQRHDMHSSVPHSGVPQLGHMPEGTPVPEPVDGMTTGELDAIDKGMWPEVPAEVGEPKRGRGRRRDDAAAALTDQRGPDVGEVKAGAAG